MSKRSLSATVGDWVASVVVLVALAFMFEVYAYALVSFAGLQPVVGILTASIMGAVFIRQIIRGLNCRAVDAPAETPDGTPQSN